MHQYNFGVKDQDAASHTCLRKRPVKGPGKRCMVEEENTQSALRQDTEDAFPLSSLAANVNSPELTLLNDAIQSLEEGFALFDSDMRFILSNDTFADLALTKHDPGPSKGQFLSEIIAGAVTPDAYVIPENTSPERLVEELLSYVASYGRGMELQRKDGRFILLSSNKTGLGGRLVTALDITERKRAEQAERKATEFLNEIMDNCPANLLMATVETGEVLYRSPPSKDLFGEKQSARSHWRNPAKRDDYISVLLRDGRINDMFTYGVRTDGTVFPAQVSARLIDHGGEKVVISSTTDLTETLALRAKTEQANAALRRGIEALDEGFVFYDENLRFVLANQRYKDALAPYDHLMVPGTPIADIVGRAIRDGHIRLLGKQLNGLEDILAALQETKQGRFEIILPDGSQKIVTASRLDNGCLIATMVDITDQRDTEKRAREMFTDILETLSEGVALYDDDERLVLHNSKYLELLHLDPATNLIGATAPDMVRSVIRSGFFLVPDGRTPEDHGKARLDQIRRGAKGTEIATAHGHLLASSSVTPLGGRLITLESLTEQRRAEQTLVDAIRHLPIGVAVERPDGTVTHCNDAFASFYGRTADELQSLSFEERMEIIYPRIATLFGRPMAADPMEPHRTVQALQRDSFAIIEASLKDGRHYLLDRAATRGDGRVVIMADVTALKDADAKSLAAVNDALQSLDLALVLWDQDMKFVMANQKWQQYFFEALDPPGIGDSAAAIMKTLIESDFFALPEKTSKQEYGDRLLSAIAGYEKRVPLETKTGQNLQLSTHETGAGGYLVSFNDVTEQRRAEAELEQQRAFAYQNEKLLALGELLAGVAHELNNPLSIVVGYAQMLEGKLRDPILARRVDRILQAAERSAKIVRTFLAMARQRKTNLDECSLNEIVRIALDIAGYGLRSNGTRVVLELEDALPTVAGDEDQLIQVLINLIVNAEHALENTGEAGKITLRTFLDAGSGNVVVEVCDNGDGIPKELQDRIFEPFFTTKNVGRGTGIGLAFCHRIIDSHGGRLGLESTPGLGTKFFIHLRAATIPDASVAHAVCPESQPANCRILIVDDEPDVAQLISDLLEERGFAVSALTKATDALHLIQTQTYDVILSDFKMPGMNGEVFHNTLLATAPRYKGRIGYITGDAMSPETAEFLKKMECPYIEKPIENHRLLKLIEQLTAAKTHLTH